jgi:hypothetical protein
MRWGHCPLRGGVKGDVIWNFKSQIIWHCKVFLDGLSSPMTLAEMVPNEYNSNCNYWYVYQELGPEWTITRDGTMHDGQCVHKKHTCPIGATVDSNARN